MKLILIFISTFLMSWAAQAKSCASRNSEIAKISNLTSAVQPFGVWEGSSNGKKISVTLGTDTNGRFRGSANFNGSNFGPMNMTLCEYADGFTFRISFFEIAFDVLAPNRILIYFEFEGSDTITLTRAK